LVEVFKYFYQPLSRCWSYDHRHFLRRRKPSRTVSSFFGDNTKKGEIN
jgi:hypothetical protein